MRRAGRRIPWKIVANSPGSAGHIRTHYCAYPGKEVYKVAEFFGEPALPSLYEPQLLGIADDVLLLRGFEEVKDRNGSFTVLQEWRCEPA